MAVRSLMPAGVLNNRTKQMASGTPPIHRHDRRCPQRLLNLSTVLPANRSQNPAQIFVTP